MVVVFDGGGNTYHSLRDALLLLAYISDREEQFQGLSFILLTIAFRWAVGQCEDSTNCQVCLLQL